MTKFIFEIAFLFSYGKMIPDREAPGIRKGANQRGKGGIVLNHTMRKEMGE